MTHLLLTNDYPPKVGGIQNYLWELWRRLPQESFHVLTAPHPDAAAFDAQQEHTVHRHRRFWLAPTPEVREHARQVADEIDASLVVIDPAFPLGALGSSLGRPYAVVLHGAEVTVPSRMPGASHALRRAVAGASLVISASRYAEREARRLCGSNFPPTVYVPPGVDVDRFVPLSKDSRRAARTRFGLDPEAPVVVGVSRLVARKGFDSLIRASARLKVDYPKLQVVIAGRGRHEAQLRRAIGRLDAPVRLIGHVADDELPSLYGCADVFAMLCRDRWGGLEQEGFGIVFVEAAAAGCPQIAGASGGSAEAVEHGRTGLVVDTPKVVEAVADALRALIADPAMRGRFAENSRTVAEERFSYDVLAQRLQQSLDPLGAFDAARSVDSL